MIPIILLFAIAMVVTIRLTHQGMNLATGMENLESIVLTDMNGDQCQLAELLTAKKSTFMMLMETDNCPPCIYKGIQDLSALKKSGHCCFVVVVHNWPDEIGGWSQNYAFSPFYVLPETSFYRHFNLTHLPVILKLKNRRIKNIRYITN